MNNYRCLPLLFLGFCSQLACSHAATEAAELPALETLFYTPAQRQEMTRARAGTAQSAASITFTGVVRRAAGNSTVWLNGKPLSEGVAQTPALKGLDAVVQGQRLRVGESLDKVTGQRSDVVAPGAVTVRSKK